jgi:hypothetical protein
MPDSPYLSASPIARSREKLRSRPVFLALSRLGFVALLVVLGVEILRLSLGDFLSGANPALAVVVDPTQAEAHLSVSEALMAAKPPKIDEAVASARLALGTNPFFPEALTLLARASEQIGDQDRTTRLMTLASRVNPRDLRSELWLLDQDLRRTNVESALQHIDVLLRGQNGAVIQLLKPTLTQILTHEPYRLAYAKLLLTNPPWRDQWFSHLVSNATDLSALTYLFAELQAIGPGPTETELRTVLTRLTEHGMYDEAHDTWIRSLPPERREEADLLYNSGLHYPLTNLPFDWVIASASNASVSIETQPAAKTIMNVDFYGGRVKFEHVSHLLNLAPGPYRFQGRERSQALQNERGLRWRIACLDGDGETLGTTDLITGDIAWRTFTMDFTVPTGKCPYQYLVLELPARTALETEVAGRVSYADLNLQPRQAREGGMSHI